MRFLVTGGAGFIGSNLVSALLARGDHVVVLDNGATGDPTAMAAAASLEVRIGDVRRRDDVLAAVRATDAVFHMAAAVGNMRSLEHPVGDLETNAMGTLNVLQACREVGVRNLIYSSSAAIFGEPRYIPIDEEHPIAPVSPYGLTKYAGERYCLVLGPTYGVRVCCLRYFNVYGTGQRYDAYGNVLPIFVTRALRGEPLTVYGDGLQTRDFVAIDDVVSANIRAFESGAEGVFNIGTGEPTTVSEVVRRVLEMTDSRSDVVRTGRRLGDVRHATADITRARNVLGYAPRVSFIEGLERYVAWVSWLQSS